MAALMRSLIYGFAAIGLSLSGGAAVAQMSPAQMKAQKDRAIQAKAAAAAKARAQAVTAARQQVVRAEAQRQAKAKAAAAAKEQAWIRARDSFSQNQQKTLSEKIVSLHLGFGQVRTKGTVLAYQMSCEANGKNYRWDNSYQSRVEINSSLGRRVLIYSFKNNVYQDCWTDSSNIFWDWESGDVVAEDQSVVRLLKVSGDEYPQVGEKVRYGDLIKGWEDWGGPDSKFVSLLNDSKIEIGSSISYTRLHKGENYIFSVIINKFGIDGNIVDSEILDSYIIDKIKYQSFDLESHCTVEADNFPGATVLETFVDKTGIKFSSVIAKGRDLYLFNWSDENQSLCEDMD